MGVYLSVVVVPNSILAAWQATRGIAAARFGLICAGHGIRITIPHKQNECHSGPFDRSIYRLRERVERLINRMKQNRRLATRYDKCAENYRAMWLIAATLLWL
jgi:transposase